MPGMTGTELAEKYDANILDFRRLAKPYTQAQLATEIAHLLPNGRDGF